MTISQIVARSFRDDRIDELERENTELSAKIREQQAIIQTQQKTIAALEWRAPPTDLWVELAPISAIPHPTWL
jgi:hypothetical protein